MIDPALITNAASPDPDTRELALDALGDDLSPEAQAIILRALAEDPDDSVRGTAAWNLKEAGTSEARSALLRAVAGDTSEHVRAEALQALQPYRHADVLDALLAEIDRPKRSRSPRQAVARQLGDFDDDRAVHGLGRLLEDEDVFVRDWAADSLLKLNRPAARPYWERALKDVSFDVRDAAERALAELDRPAS